MSEQFTKEELRALALQKYLSGIRSPKAIAEVLGVPDRTAEIAAYFASEPFQVALRRAKRDMASSVVDTIKERMHVYLDELEKLALASIDPRVKVAALKDLLDRGGTGGMQKVSLTSPAAYKKALSEFTDDKESTDELSVPGTTGPKVRQGGNGVDVGGDKPPVPTGGS